VTGFELKDPDRPIEKLLHGARVSRMVAVKNSMKRRLVRSRRVRIMALT
jgi:hypothetical protein